VDWYGTVCLLESRGYGLCVGWRGQGTDPAIWTGAGQDDTSIKVLGDSGNPDFFLEHFLSRLLCPE